MLYSINYSFELYFTHGSFKISLEFELFRSSLIINLESTLQQQEAERYNLSTR